MTTGRIDLVLASEAEQTLEQVREVSGADGVPKEVFSRLRGLPVMLRVNGVPATLAFYAAKSNPTTPIGRAYHKISAALHGKVAESLGLSPAPLRLYRELRDRPYPDLLLAFARLEAYAQWLRRLAEALDHEQERQGAGGAA